MTTTINQAPRLDYFSYVIPQWAVCPIEYGDLSGLTPDEVTDLDSFMNDLPKRIYSIEYGDEPRFAGGNDIRRNEGGDVIDCKVYVEVKT